MKKALIVLFTLGFSGLLLVSCEKSEPPKSVVQADAAAFDLSMMRSTIEAKNQEFTQAHVIGDREAIDKMFTDDAKVLPPGADPVIGRVAIDQLTAQFLEYGIVEFHQETTEVYGNEQMLIDQGNYILAFGKENAVERGKYLNVWKSVNGEWKIYSNIWNTNAPESP